MKTKSSISIAILVCITMICSTLFSSAAAFAESKEGDGYPTDKIEKYMDSKSVAIHTSDGQYNPGESLDPNGSFEFSIGFSERNNGRQFPEDGKMYYDIPEVIQITKAINNENILEEGSKDKVIGTYSISKEGKISVALDKAYIGKYDNVKVKVSFKGEFEKKFTEGGDDKYIEFSDGIKVEVNFKKIVKLKLTKSHSSFDYEKNQLTYTVNLKSDHDTTDVLVTDTPESNLTFVPKTLSVYDNNGKQNVTDYQLMKDTDSGWQIKFPKVEKNTDYNITYTAKLSQTAVDKINDSTSTGASVAVNNKVTATAEDAAQVETTDGHTIGSFQRLQKDVKEDKANNKLTWTVTVNAKKFFDVSGCKVIDTLPNGLTLKSGSVKVQKDGKDANEAQVKETANGWEYQIPENPKDNYSVYTFTYDTNLPVNNTANNVTYNNKVQLIWSNKTITVNKGYTADKGIVTAVNKYLTSTDTDNSAGYNKAVEMDDQGNRYIHYGVWIDVPAGGIPNAVLRDVVDKDLNGNPGLTQVLYNGLKVTTKDQIKDLNVNEKFKYITVKNYDAGDLIIDQSELKTGGFKMYFGSKENSKIKDTGKAYRIYLQYYTKITGSQYSKDAWNFIYLDLAGGDSVNDWENTKINTKIDGNKQGNYDAKTGIITWTVNVGTETNKAGLGTDPIFIEDEFSDNQSYVEGSAKLNGKELATGKVTGEKNKYKFDLGVCDQLQQYTLVYQTKVNDGIFDSGETVQFKNKAAVKNQQGLVLDIPEKVLTEKNESIGKVISQKPDKDNKYAAKYTLTVNPNRAILAEKDSEYIIEDNYSEHLRIDTDTVKIVKDDKETLNQKQYTISGGIGGDPLKITIPEADGHKFVISYDATAFGNVGDTVTINNTAALKAGTKSSSSDSKGEVTFESQDSNASGIGSLTEFSVMKCDYANVSKGLEGAKFSLYKDSVSEANYLGSATTDQDGKAKFSKANLTYSEKAYSPEGGIKYILVEETAPNGYEKGGKVEFQLLGDEPQLDNIPLYKMGDTIKVTNQKYNFYIKKVAEETGKALAGAEFSLFNDKDCKTEAVQTVKEDKNQAGQFTFKGLTSKTYYLKETKVPEGYYNSEKIYTVVIDTDGNATIDGEPVSKDDRTYEITNTLAGSIKVTKEVKEDGIGTSDYKIYHTALFSDKALQNRISKVKDLEMNGNKSAAVTFNDLKIDETYYVAETDKDGNALSNENNAIGAVVSYDDQVIKLDPNNLKGETKITNSYYSEYYWSGSIDVTKIVTMGGEAAETNKVFYVGLYNDKDFTDRVGDIQKLDMGGKSKTTVTFSDLPINSTYYVAETDAEGNVITDSQAQLGCEMTIDHDKISLTKEKQEGAAEITNAFPNEYNFYIHKVSAHTGETLEGAEFTLFKDTACKDKKVTATGDENGKFVFKNLIEGTYYLKETKVPKGYHDSEKIYTVEINADGKAVIDGEAVPEDKTFTVENTLAGSIEVTKEVKEDGIGTADYKTYYAALFSDREFQNRVSDVEKLEMNGNQSTTVTFDNLKVNETYYVAETDEQGNALPNKNDDGQWIVDYENQVVTLDPSNLKAESKITNSYYSNYYWAGSIDVTKHVKVGGKEAETNNIFYVGIYTDTKCTQQLGDIKPLVMDGKATTTVTFSDLPVNHTYYIAETDSKGKVITNSQEQLGCEMTIDNNKIELTKENTTGSAEITNDFPDEEQFYYDGEITVKKTTTHNGKAFNTNDVFYVALFADKAHTKRITDVKALEMNGKNKAEVSFNNLAYGAYYLAETDKDGKALSEVKAAELGFTNLLDEEVQLDQDPVEIELENQMTSEYVKTKAGSATQTGDDSDMTLALLGMLAALTVMAILAIGRKRRRS